MQGISLEELKQAGYTIKDLKAAQFTPAELRAVDFAAHELTAAGYTVEELKAGGFTVRAPFHPGDALTFCHHPQILASYHWCPAPVLDTRMITPLHACMHLLI